MKKKYNGQIKKTILLMLLAVVMSTTALFALFSSDIIKDIDADSSGLIDISLSITDENNVTSSSGLSNISFTQVGEKKSFTLSVSNNKATHNLIGYNLDFDIATASNIGNSVIIHLDGVAIGSLGYLINAKQNSIYIEKPLFVGESRTHNLELEYHLDSASDSTAFNFSAVAKGRTNANKTYIYVQNEKQFRSVVNENNLNGAHKNKTIYLVNDITLTKNIEIINSAFSIDLNGHKLNLSDISMSFVSDAVSPFSGVAKIYSSRMGGAIVGGSVSLNSSSGLLLYDGQYTVSQYSNKLLVDEVSSEIKTLTHSGVNVVEMNLSNYFIKYSQLSEPLAKLDIISVGNSSAYLNGKLSFTLPQTTTFSGVTVNSGDSNQYVSFKLFGTDTQVANEFIINNVNFLTKATDINNPLQFSYSLFLPTMGKESDVTVRWISSNTSVLTDNGIYNKPPKEQIIELTAIVSYGDKTEMLTFYLQATAKSGEQLMREFCQQQGIQITSLFTAYPLPVDSDPLAMEMGLTNITHKLPDATDLSEYFKIESNHIALVVNTSAEGAYVEISATIQGVTYIGKLPVYVILTGSVSIIEQAHTAVKNSMSGINKNTLDSFDLIDNYKDVDISYSLFSTTGEEIGGKNYANSLQVLNCVTVSGKSFVIDKYNLPIENSTVYIKVVYTYGNFPAEVYVIEFTLSGAIYNNSKGIVDLTLYTKLYQLLDINRDSILTRDEIEESSKTSSTSLSLRDSGISNIKGLEYFTFFTLIDLYNNKLTDISPLLNMHTLISLNLGRNSLSDVEVLSNLQSLEELNLSNNIGLVDVSSLKVLTNMKKLELEYNTNIIDFKFLESYHDLAELSVLRCFDYSTTYIPRASLFTAYDNYVKKHGSVPNYRYSASNETALRLTPNALELHYTKMINGIVPVYRIANVLYLPGVLPYVDVNGVVKNYKLQWSLGANSGNILTLNADGTVTINQPIVDTRLYIIAILDSGINGDTSLNAHIEKSFEVLSIKGDGNAYKSYFLNMQTPTESIFNDSTLIGHIFRTYDTNKDNLLSAEEVSMITSLDLRNMKIYDLTGINKLTSLTTLYLDKRPVNELVPSLFPSSFGRLYLSNDTFDISGLQTMTTLNVLSIYGTANSQAEDTLQSLFNLFTNTTGKIAILLEKEHTISAPWDPYKDILINGLSQIEDMYEISYNSGVKTLVKTVQVKLYGSVFTATIEYTYSSSSAILTYNVTNGTLSMSLANIPMQDTVQVLTATISLKGYSKNTYSKVIPVIATTDKSIMVEMLAEDGVSIVRENMHNYVTDKDFWKELMAKRVIDNNQKLVTRTALASFTTLNIKNSDLNILKMFTKLNISNLVLTGYHSFNRNTEFLNKTNFPSLTTVSIEGSYIDMFDFQYLTNMKSLTISYGIGFVFDRKVNGVEENIFNKLEYLDILDLSNGNYMFHYAFLAQMQRVTTLRVYGTNASPNTTNNLYLSMAFENLIRNLGSDVNYDWRVVDKDTKWQPDISVVNTIKEYSVFSVKSSVETKAEAGEHKANYLTGVGNSIKLPHKYEFPKLANQPNVEIIWTSSAPDIINVNTVNSSTNIYETISINQPNDDTYVTLTGLIATYNKTIIYNYVIRGSVIRGSSDTSTNMQLKDFFGDDGKLADAYFTYIVFSELNKKLPNVTNGVYLKTEVATIASLEYPNDIIESIKGIKNLTGLTLLNLSNNVISDISELSCLTNLTTLNLKENKITTLWVNGTSVFSKMTSLTVLQIQKNPAITDYSAISYDTLGSTVNRVGLANLEKVGSYPILIPGWAFSGNNLDTTVLVCRDPYSYLIPWIDEVATVKMTDTKLGLWTSENATPNISGSNLVSQYRNLKILNSLSAFNVKRITGAGATIESDDFPLNKETTINVPNFSSSNWRNTANASGNFVYGLKSFYNGNFGIDATTRKVTKLDGELAIANRTLPLMIGINSTDTVYRIVDLNITIGESGTSTDEITLDGVKANTIFKDPALLLYIRQLVGTNTMTTANLANLSTFAPTNRGITDISGMEYIFNNNTKIKQYSFGYNNIVSLPKMNLTTTTTIKLDIRNNAQLIDISALGFVGSGGISLGSKITDLNISELSSLPTAQTTYLSSTHMPNLSILRLSQDEKTGVSNLSNKVTESRFSSYEFLLGLNKYLSQLEMRIKTSKSIPQMLKNGNAEYIKQTLLTLGTGEGLKSADIYTLGDRVSLYSDYLFLPLQFDNDVDILLPTLILINGMEFNITWKVPTDYMVANAPAGYIKINVPSGTTSLSPQTQLSYQGSKTYSETINLNFGMPVETTVTFDLSVQLSEGGEYVMLSTIMPDIRLRSDIVEKFRGLSGNYANIMAIETLSISNFLDLKGIEIFKNLKELTIGSTKISDFRPLSSLTHMRKLTINYALNMVNLDFILSMPQLEMINLRDSICQDIFAIYDMNIKEIYNISQIANSGHGNEVANMLAYNRVFKQLSDLGSSILTNMEHVKASTIDEKFSVMVLNELNTKNWSFVGDSYYKLSYSANSTLDVPTTISYYGKEYTVSVRVLSSGNTTQNGNKLTFLSNPNNKKVRFTVMLEYNSGRFERYFEVEVA